MKDKPTKGIDYTGVSVVFLCHDGNGNVLMNRRSKHARDEHGRWDIGGGGLKFGETAEECLFREINEEYCANVIGYEFMGYRDVHRILDGKPTHWVALDFIVHIDPSNVAIGDPLKMDEIGWFALDAFPPDSKKHSQVPFFWNKYIEKITKTIN